MPAASYFPHIDLLLQALRTSRGRLDSRSKIAVDPRLLAHLIKHIIATLPFDEAFYQTTYDDVAVAHGTGEIPDLHAHFVETGFFEGRFGADPTVDGSYYRSTYPDVDQAIRDGQIRAANDHYVQRGAAESRAPTPGLAPTVERWMAVLRPDG